MARLPSGYWYMSKHGSGFTGIEEQALTVRVGDQDLPVLAPGYVHGWARDAHKRQIKVWRILLDAMETEMDLEEEYESKTEDVLEIRQAKEKLDNHRAKMVGLKEALAMLSYGNIDRDAMALIDAQANARYDQES